MKPEAVVCHKNKFGLGFELVMANHNITHSKNLMNNEKN